MPTFALVWGIVVFVVFAMALVPCLGWINWLNIPASLFGVLFGILGMVDANKRREPPGPAIAGLILSVCAAFLGLIRLMLGGGIF